MHLQQQVAKHVQEYLNEHLKALIQDELLHKSNNGSDANICRRRKQQNDGGDRNDTDGSEPAANKFDANVQPPNVRYRPAPGSPDSYRNADGSKRCTRRKERRVCHPEKWFAFVACITVCILWGQINRLNGKLNSPVDCVLSEYWEKAPLDTDEHDGYTVEVMRILQYPRNAGKSCPVNVRVIPRNPTTAKKANFNKTAEDIQSQLQPQRQSQSNQQRKGQHRLQQQQQHQHQSQQQHQNQQQQRQRRQRQEQGEQNVGDLSRQTTEDEEYSNYDGHTDNRLQECRGKRCNSRREKSDGDENIEGNEEQEDLEKFEEVEEEDVDEEPEDDDHEIYHGVDHMLNRLSQKYEAMRRSNFRYPTESQDSPDPDEGEEEAEAIEDDEVVDVSKLLRRNLRQQREASRKQNGIYGKRTGEKHFFDRKKLNKKRRKQHQKEPEKKQNKRRNSDRR